MTGEAGRVAGVLLRIGDYILYLPLCIRTVSAVLVDVCAVTTVTKLNQMITTCSDTRDTRLGSM